MLKALTLPLKIVWWVFVFVTPVLAVWLASSLAIFSNGPTWLAVSAGALLFPILPLVWDAWGTRRFDKKQEAREAADKERKDRFLKFGDRLVLRTLVINLAFVVGLLAVFPERAFTALSTRGDWPLDHVESTEQTENVRDVAFEVAAMLEVVHNWARDNPYATDVDDGAPDPDSSEIGEVSVAERDTSKVDEADPADGTADDADSDGAVVADGPDLGDGATWPLPNEIHPLVADLPEGTETSVQAVAKYIAANESDPFQRVKAMHDFVADRTAYDIGTFGAKQDAATVFERKTAVCEGYARMLVEMGREIPEEIVYIPGVSRGIGGEVGGGGHAWNAAKIEGKWYLIDPTWNAGASTNGKFEKNYRTDYLFTPPDIFVVDHLPENERWQLLEEPISRGEFMRRPMMRTGFYREGLVLLDPKRSQVSVDERAVVTVANPRRRQVVASLYRPQGERVGRCDVVPGRERERIECAVPDAGGRYQVQLFAGEPGARRLPFVGQIEVVR